MTYLLANYWVWILASFLMGAVIGFMTVCPNEEGYWPKKWPLSFLMLLLALGAGLIVALLGPLSGKAALWLETATLFLSAYLTGCFIGSFFGARCGCRKGKAPENNSDIPASPLGIVSKVSEAKSTDKEPSSNEHPGAKPIGLAAAHEGKKDDLKLIAGIGSVNETKLHGLGIWYFRQIADWTPENMEWVGSYLAFPGRIEREDWVGQAKVLAQGQETEFAQRVKKGDVPTSL